MTDPDDTLSAIDAAIEGWVDRDFSVSDDAMRCAPGPPPTGFAHGQGRVYFAPAGTPRDLSDSRWTEVGDALGEVVVDLSPRRPSTLTLTPEQVQVFRHFADHMRRQHNAMRRAIQEMAKGVLKVATRAHAVTAPTTYGDDYRRHRRNCRACNPAGNPKPLKVNGADYARRRKNRRRRAR